MVYEDRKGEREPMANRWIFFHWREAIFFFAITSDIELPITCAIGPGLLAFCYSRPTVGNMGGLT